LSLEERTVRFDEGLRVEAYRFKGIMQKFPNHFHEYYVIGFIESGNRRLSCKNKTYTIHPGDLLLFNPLDNHTCEQLDSQALDYCCLNIESAVMQAAVKEITGTTALPQFKQTVILGSKKVLCLKKLHQTIMDGQANLHKEEFFLSLIEQLLADEKTPLLPPDYVSVLHLQTAKVCDYIHDHYPEHISLDTLSSIAQMNKYSLLRAFTKIKGITPYRYLETIRINEAKKLLEKGSAPLDSALQTGFVDQSHFTNRFKESIGLTPGQYQSIFNKKSIHTI
jgi:AraC-like DNA-binding protein